jgi:protein-S-isoprenylcysteine O-methyltransferase Ste14
MGISTHETTDRSLAAIVGDATRELSTLFRQEVELAKSELRSEVAKAGTGAALIGAAGVLAAIAALAFSSALGLALWQLWLEPWAAALVVGLLYVVAAAVLALSGKRALGGFAPPARTIRTIKEDVAWARSRKS